MIIADIIREYFPDATDEFCEFVLWEKTGYPSFWNIPSDGNTPEECMRKQLQEFKNEVTFSVSQSQYQKSEDPQSEP